MFNPIVLFGVIQLWQVLFDEQVIHPLIIYEQITHLSSCWKYCRISSHLQPLWSGVNVKFECEHVKHLSASVHVKQFFIFSGHNMHYNEGINMYESYWLIPKKL